MPACRKWRMIGCDQLTNVGVRWWLVPKIGEHAVVLGASMAGLLAARVLSDFYRTVTLVERDVLPDDPVNRRGVPQGRQPHILLSRCSQILDELFPGFLDELVAAGVSCNNGDLTRFWIAVGGHQLVRSGTLPMSKAIPAYYPSRPFLEWNVRRRLKAIENVTTLDGHDVVGLTSTQDRNRVTGVRVVNHDGGAEQRLTADLVVDATGRGSRTPAFLEELGYGRPREDELVVRLAYASLPVRFPPGAIPEDVIAIFPEPGRPRLFALVGNENDTWVAGVGAMAGVEPPSSRADMIAFAAGFAPPHALAALQVAEPLGEVAQYRVPSNRWRRYDKMRRTPKGLIVFGDAVCSLNPIYGQGMTVAALDAVVLRECLARGERDLPRRFFRATAKKIRVAWQTAVGSDLALPEVVGRRPLSMRITNAYLDWALRAAETDPIVTLQFTRVTGMVDSPFRLFHPSFIYRVATANLRRHARRHPAVAVHVTLGDRGAVS